MVSQISESSDALSLPETLQFVCRIITNKFFLCTICISFSTEVLFPCYSGERVCINLLVSHLSGICVWLYCCVQPEYWLGLRGVKFLRNDDPRRRLQEARLLFRMKGAPVLAKVLCVRQQSVLCATYSWLT